MGARLSLWLIALAVLGGQPCSSEEFDVSIVSVAVRGADSTSPAAGAPIEGWMPFGVLVGPHGALYITDIQHHRVLRLDLTSGEFATVAGCGRRGYAGDGGPATAAELNEPYEVQFDSHGNLYIVDMQNHAVRRVDRTTGVIATIAGTGEPGFSGDGGPGARAQLRQPHSIAIDDDNQLYIADIGNHRIRRLDLRTDEIDSVAGNGEARASQDGQLANGQPILGPRALFVAGDTLWIALREGHSVWRMDLKTLTLHHVAGSGKPGCLGDGGSAALAEFNGPKGIAADKAGNVFVVDSGNNALRRIRARERVVDAILPRQSGIRLSAGPQSLGLNQAHGVCVGAEGEIFVADSLNRRILRVAASQSE